MKLANDKFFETHFGINHKVDVHAVLTHNANLIVVNDTGTIYYTNHHIIDGTVSDHLLFETSYVEFLAELQVTHPIKSPGITHQFHLQLIARLYATSKLAGGSVYKE